VKRVNSRAVEESNIRKTEAAEPIAGSKTMVLVLLDRTARLASDL
jgi:hypothetical protein